MPHHLACKHTARIFYIQGRHLLMVQGTRHAGTDIEINESLRPTGDALTLRLSHPNPGAPETDSYYLLRPVFTAGPPRRSVRLVHRGGWDQLRVEPVNCASFRATGISPNFDFDEAFADALRQLPCFSSLDPAGPLPLVDVLAMGVLYGGFAGYTRLFVRVEARWERPPYTLPATP